MFCPKSSPFHLYRWAKGGGIPSCNKIFFLGGASIISTFFCDGPIKITYCKKKVGLVRHPQLININCNMFSNVPNLWYLHTLNMDSIKYFLNKRFGASIHRKSCGRIWTHQALTCVFFLLEFFVHCSEFVQAPETWPNEIRVEKNVVGFHVVWHKITNVICNEQGKMLRLKICS